jgi:biopolymer transport protein ExbD
MGMSPFASDDDDGLMNEINMTPLVDVMLVLLIVFMVTIPVIRHAVKVDLPHASSQKEETKPVQVNVSVEADGTVLWDEQKVSDDELRAKIEQAAKASPQPELHLNADRKVAYEKVAEVMSAAQAGGLTKIGFVTQPVSLHRLMKAFFCAHTAPSGGEITCYRMSSERLHMRQPCSTRTARSALSGSL